MSFSSRFLGFFAAVVLAGVLARASDESLPTGGGPTSATKASPSNSSAMTNTGVSPGAPEMNDGRIATLRPADLRDFEAQPAAVKKLLASGLELTTHHLAYTYGSSDPERGGMDCSGTIYYLLTQAGLKDVPRDASEMYRWVWTRSSLQAVVSSNPDTFELARLKPGDLLFWSGTYRVDHDPPITHVMIYLGINRSTGRRVMVGASEGRRFNDKPRYGVSVFDFILPNPKNTPDPSSEPSSELQARFVGYSAIPGLENAPANGPNP